MSVWWAMSALLGVVTGLWLRVPAVLALTILVALVAVVSGLVAEESLGQSLIHALAVVVFLQLGYVVGLLIATGRGRWSR